MALLLRGDGFDGGKKVGILGVVVLVATMVIGVQGQSTRSDVAGFLQPQNNARAQVGLRPLQWDTRLASYAQWWARQRKLHGGCRLQHSNGPYGENIFWGYGKAWQPADAANTWIAERKWYRYSSNSCSSNHQCGHYTQVVWRGTTRVGCARSVCSNGSIFMTCNYYPPGNWIGQRPY